MYLICQDLESKANGSLDYSQLNRDLSQTGTMFTPENAFRVGKKGMVQGEEHDDRQYPESEMSFDKVSRFFSLPCIYS